LEELLLHLEGSAVLNLRQFSDDKMLNMNIDLKIRLQKISIVSWIFLLSTDCCQCQKTISLSQAINAALANRKSIQAGKLDSTIRKLQTKSLQKKYWPQISLEYGYQYNPILQTSILPIGLFNPAYPVDATKGIRFGTKWSQATGLNLTQPLLDGSIRRQINEASLQERIAWEMQAQTEYELAYDVAVAFLNLKLQLERIQSAVADTARTGISLQLQKEKFDANRLLKSDLNKARINHNNALQKLNDALSQFDENKVYFFYVTGQSNVEIKNVEFGQSFFSEKTYQSFQFLHQMDSLPELKKLKLQATLPALQQESEKSKYSPTLNLKGFLGANQYTNNFNPVQSGTWFGLSYIGLNIKFPLLFGEDKQRKLKQLQLQSFQSTLQLQEKISELEKDAAAARIKMLRINSNLATLKENISLTEESIAIFQDRVKEGQETASTLNTEEASLQSLTAEYELNKIQLWIYWLDYLKASGQLYKLWK
jgi:outer membrane protein TolC